MIYETIFPHGQLHMVDIPTPRQIYQWCERRLQQGPGEKSIW